MIIHGVKSKWEPIIGLEIHAQLNTNSKLFSYSSTNFGQENNEQVSLVDAAMPGVLPVTNKRCVEFAVRAGLALNATINKFSIFDRKNYFYPDSPQGYQISQFFYPIISDGNIEITCKNNQNKKISINRIHIEQDAGKSIHNKSLNETFIDLNRVGISLIEIVTNPDFSSPEEVQKFIKKLRNILMYIDVCDGDLAQGSIRCDANISVKQIGKKELGTRVEVKNLNSLKNISKAILYEANRQVILLENNGNLYQETRLFDIHSGKTKSMRKKEEASDYRYFPDPDLLPLIISADFIDNIKRDLPELPEDKKKRYIKDYNLTEYDVEVLTAEKDVAEFFEIVVQKIDSKLAANWICVELFGRLNKFNIEFNHLSISTHHFIALLELLASKKISGKIAKDILDKMFQTNAHPREIIQKYNLMQISNVVQIQKYVDNICDMYPKKVKEFQSGKKKLFSFFIGQVMKVSCGRANPEVVNKILIKKLYSN